MRRNHLLNILRSDRYIKFVCYGAFKFVASGKMSVKFVACFVISCLALCEMRPLSSISEDMGIIVRCNATYPVSKRTLNLALIERRFEGEVNRNFKCFLQCLYYNYEWMDSSGNFRHFAIRNGLSESTLTDDEIDYLLNTCTKIKNEDRCDRALTFTECFWAENAKLEETSSSMEWQRSNW